MTLFIAETNDRVRQRLASIAASVEGITVVGEAGEVKEAVGGINRTRPDSVIIAMPMSGGSGLEVLAAAKSARLSSTAIILTSAPCSECEHRCFSMGADYFFEKSGELKKLVTTLVLLAHGNSQQSSVEHGHRGDATTQPSDDSLPAAPQTLLNVIPEVCPRLIAISKAKSRSCFLTGTAQRSTSSPSIPLTG